MKANTAVIVSSKIGADGTPQDDTQQILQFFEKTKPTNTGNAGSTQYRIPQWKANGNDGQPS